METVGIEPTPTCLQGSFAGLGTCVPTNAEVRPGVEPGLPPYHGGVPPQHLQTVNDPGWTRTIDVLGVSEAPLPLGHGTKSGAYGGRSRTSASTGQHAEPLHQGTVQ